MAAEAKSRMRAGAVLLLLGWLLAGCQQDVEGRQARLAYVAPYQLALYSRLGPKAEVIGNLRHGESARILETHRVFARIRTDGGEEGWVDSRDLLTIEQMEELRSLADYAVQLPSQGAATVYDDLNVHTAPYRGAPSFHRLRMDEKAEVVAHLVMPRLPYAAANPAKPQKPSQEGSFSPKSVLASLSEDVDWVEYYRRVAREAEAVPGDRAEDWNLIRLKDARAGWVLSRPLTMSIPEEVAQYSGGQQITSYFSLGEAAGSAGRHHWLWTTRRQSRQPYQFDGFRVFIWNARNQRYETARMGANLQGYYPVEAEVLENGDAQFRLLIRQENGLQRVTYILSKNRVSEAGREPVAEPVAEGPATAPEQKPRPSWWQLIRNRVEQLWS